MYSPRPEARTDARRPRRCWVSPFCCVSPLSLFLLRGRSSGRRTLFFHSFIFVVRPPSLPLPPLPHCHWPPPARLNSVVHTSVSPPRPPLTLSAPDSLPPQPPPSRRPISGPPHRPGQFRRDALMMFPAPPPCWSSPSPLQSWIELKSDEKLI